MDILWTTATFVVLQIAVLAVIRVFPAVLTTVLTKRVEHRYSAKLSKLKADLDARYSTLKSSVDFISASQSDLRTRAIASVEALWTIVLEIEHEHRNLVVLDGLLAPEEIQKGFVSGTIKKLLGDYSDFDVVVKKVAPITEFTCEKERLFSGERLWLLFSTLCRAHGRMAMLAQRSFEKRTYIDWRTDDLMNRTLCAVLPANVLEQTKAMRVGGFRDVTGRLKAEFLKEAIRVTSGSRHVADSLSDLQSTLLSEQQRLTSDGSQRVST